MRIALPLILLCFFSSLSAQRIDLEDFNEELLEQEILVRMNRHRQARGLAALERDRILAEAAFDQAVYLDYIGDLTHEQSSRSKSSPQKRVAYFEGTHAPIGENVTFINYEELNYAVVADRFFLAWQRSDADYANIASAAYQYTGIRFSIDQVNRRIYGVQVFGGPQGLELTAAASGRSFMEDNKAILKEFDPMECRKAVSYKNIAASLPGRITLSQDSIFLSFPSKELLQKVIAEESNDGIALDIIKRNQLVCNGSHNLDRAFTHDGMLIPMISAEDLYSSNENGDKDQLYSHIGQIPESLLNEHIQVNVLTINNNTVCRNDFAYDIPQGEMPFYRIQPIWAFKEIERKIAREKLDFLSEKIPGVVLKRPGDKVQEFPLEYESRDADIPVGGLDTIKLFAQQNIDWIESIEIQLFCSIDNSREANRQMLEARATAIRQLFLRLGIPKAKVNVLAEENWRLFYAQIENTEWAHYNQLPEEEIRTRLGNKFTKGKMANLMEAQNKFSIIFKYKEREIQNYDAYSKGLTPEEYRRIIRQMKNFIDKRLVDDALILQLELIRGLIDKKINIKDLLEIEIPAEERNLALLSNMIAVELFFQDSIPEEPYYIRYIEKVADFNDRYLPMQFNLAAFAVRYLDQTGETIFDVPDLEKMILDMYYDNYYQLTYQDKELALNRLMTNFHLTGINYYTEEDDYKLLERAFNELRDYAAVAKFSENSVLQLARFYNKAQYYDWSLSLLKPFFTGSQSSEEILFLYTQTRALTEGAPNDEKFINLLKMLRRKNAKRFCSWMNRSFQLIRSSKVKQVFCESCG